MKIRQKAGKAHSLVVARHTMLRTKRVVRRRASEVCVFPNGVENYTILPSEGTCSMSFFRIKTFCEENSLGKESTMNKEVHES